MTGFDISNTSRFETAFGGISWSYGYSRGLEDSDSPGGAATLAVAGERRLDTLFTSVEYRPTNWLTLNAGVNYVSFDVSGEYARPTLDPDTGQSFSDIDSDGSGAAPVASVTVEPWSGFQLFARYAEGYRPPSIREIANPVMFIANPDLQPEEASTWEVGINVSRDALLTEDDRLRLKFAYFDNTYDNYIVRAQHPVLGADMMDNADGAWFSGIEIQGSYDAGRVFFEGAYTYYDEAKIGCPSLDASQCRGGAFFLDYSMFHIPPEWTLSFTAGARFLDEKLVVGTRVNHASERKGGRPYGNRWSYWDAYTVADVFASYEVKDMVTLNASVENVTDRFYMDALNVTPLPAPGRTFRFGMTARF